MAFYIDPENFWHDELDNRPVMVTIRCIVYNHEKFIREALEGFVMQQTNFRFEAIVHDDCSTDGTVAIIREYAEKYPSIIKPIFETENQYSKHNGSLSRVLNEHLRGKYVAFCEGDDYWTDPHKLQKQVDFLESNPDYSMCFHNATTIYDDPSKNSHLFYQLRTRTYSGIELYKEWIVPTASILSRKDCLTSKKMQEARNNPDIKCGDVPLVLACASEGKVYCIADNMSVYRRHVSGLSASSSFVGENYLKQRMAIAKVFGAEYTKAFKKHYLCPSYISFFIDDIKKSKYRDSLIWLKKSFNESWKYSIISIFLFIQNKFKRR